MSTATSPRKRCAPSASKFVAPCAKNCMYADPCGVERASDQTNASRAPGAWKARWCERCDGQRRAIHNGLAIETRWDWAKKPSHP